MKTIITLSLALAWASVSAQSFSEKINKEFVFEKKSPDNTLFIANINGDVNVVGYTGDKIIVEVEKTITAKTESRLEAGKQDLKLQSIDRADTIILYIEDGCASFGRTSQGRKNNGWHRDGWGYNWNCNQGNCDRPYDYKMDFTVKVPSNVNLRISTINDGDLSVEKVSGIVKADNVNGSIKLTNLAREASASTINGDVDIEYVNNPNKDCRFYSLNGDINALFVKGLAANLSFESFNGAFYTNIDRIEPLPVKVEQSTNGNKGVKFKVNGNRYQVGNGGALLDFETFNGNVYLKEKQ
jgi:DUF4097 and DUF4098 domain-containing protein YvlB